MNNGIKWWCGLGALALGWTGSTLAQAPQQDPVPRAEAKAARVRQLIEQLGAAAYRDRRAAEDKLEEIGETALDALRKAAAEHTDPEVKWRAERLAQRIAGEDPPAAPRGGLRPRDGGDAPAPRDTAPRDTGPREELPPGEVFDSTQGFLDRVLRDMESGFPSDDPEWAERIRERMHAQLDELRRAMGDGRSMGMAPLPLGGLGIGRGQSVQIGPDGVRVEVQETGENGEVETKVYEAEDLETFREKHPGVLDEGGFRLDLGGGAMPPMGGWRPRPMEMPFGPGILREAAPRAGLTPVAPPPARRRLGVGVGDLHPAVRDFLGGGLLVADVQPGTLAAELGIEAGDVVMEIAGQAIDAVPDVGDALGAIDPGQPVEVLVNRRGHMKTLTATKGPDEAESEAPDEVPQKKRGLEPRK